MEVDSTDPLIAGTPGSFDFRTAAPGQMSHCPPFATPETGNANNNRRNENAPPADANRRSHSANPEPQPTLARVIAELVAPCVIPPRWKFLVGDGRPQRIDMTPAEFEVEMLEYFPPEFLLASGLFERVGEDVQLVASLVRDAALLVEIDKSNDTIILSSDDEKLIPYGHTAVQCGLQRRPEASAEPTQNLWVVGSDEEVEILKRLKLPAVLSDGLETIRKPEIEGLFAGTHRSDADWQYDLILVDFDVANLINQPATAIGGITKRLATAANVYAIDVSRRFTLLRPTANEFELLEQAADFQDSERISQLLKTWGEVAKGARFDSGITHDRREVASFTAASQTLARVLQSKTLVLSSVSEALETYRAVGRDPVIQKFHKQVEMTGDPFTKMNLLGAAQLADICFRIDPLSKEAEAVLGNQTRPSARGFDEENFARLWRCMSELRCIEKTLKPKR